MMKTDRDALKKAVDELKLGAAVRPMDSSVYAQLLRTKQFPQELQRQLPCGSTRLTVQLTRDYIEPGKYFLHLSCSLVSGAPVPRDVLAELLDLVFGDRQPMSLSYSDPTIRHFVLRVQESAASLI